MTTSTDELGLRHSDVHDEGFKRLPAAIYRAIKVRAALLSHSQEEYEDFVLTEAQLCLDAFDEGVKAGKNPTTPRTTTRF